MNTTSELQWIKTSLINTFEEVKEAVRKVEGRSRAGLMLGLQEIGSSLDGFVGAYYPIASNIIVVNATPLRRIMETDRDLLKPYAFHILLHEYIHSLGYLDERTTEQKTYEISRKYFGKNHVITQFSTRMQKFLPNLVYPVHGWVPSSSFSVIELVPGFDQSTSNSYIT
ncbi:MAG TPA: hypothetical protein VMT57_01680 [Candidatus Thermoplasmatota archaeon]|nr:hypothetical protein [Candidatus Thermoplasmatota archaeon]